jgi:hypothetical protein
MMPKCKSQFRFIARLSVIGVSIQIAFLNVSTDKHAPMGQQHRVRAKRKRRKAYLQRKRASLRATRREPPAKSKPKKQPAAPE